MYKEFFTAIDNRLYHCIIDLPDTITVNNQAAKGMGMDMNQNVMEVVNYTGSNYHIVRTECMMPKTNLDLILVLVQMQAHLFFLLDSDRMLTLS